MLFITITIVAGVLMYLFVQRVIVMKPVGMKGVDEAIDQLIERQRLKKLKEMARRRREKTRSWESTTLSEHTMEIIDSLTATTCPTLEEVHSTRTPQQWSTVASTAVSMSSDAASAAKKESTPEGFDKTFDPKEAVARKEEGGEKKHHRHHHKRHHRHRSRAEEKDRERSEDSEEGDDERRSKGGHKRHRRHRSREAATQPRLDTPLLVQGESLPGPDAVDVEMRSQEAVKTP